MEPAEVAVLRAALDPLAITLGVRVVDDADDELILIVPATESPKLNEGRLAQELAAVLGRKIWIVTDSPGGARDPRPYLTESPILMRRPQSRNSAER